MSRFSSKSSLLCLFTVGLFFIAFGVQAATITGTVKFSGAAPAVKAPPMDKTCTDKNGGKVPAADSIVLGAGNTVGNVIVYVKTGPKGKATTAKATIDQKGCMYYPHVSAVTAGSDVEFINSDGITHNVHGQGKGTGQFNGAMPATRKTMTKKFDDEQIIEVKCDVHPWMKSYIGVFKHPNYTVTAADGKFSLANLEPGTYEIEAWHEKFGKQTAKITVAKDETKTNDISFAKP